MREMRGEVGKKISSKDMENMTSRESKVVQIGLRRLRTPNKMSGCNIEFDQVINGCTILKP